MEPEMSDSHRRAAPSSCALATCENAPNTDGHASAFPKHQSIKSLAHLFRQNRSSQVLEGVSMGASPHISPRRVARPARCREMWSFRPRGPAGAPSAVRRWGLRAEVKAPGGSRCPSIVDDEQRRDRPRPPSARRVAAPWPRLLRCRSSAMENIAVVAAPGIRGHGARNGRRWGLRPDLAGRGGVLDRTSSTPRRENAADCDIFAGRSSEVVRYEG